MRSCEVLYVHIYCFNEWINKNQKRGGRTKEKEEYSGDTIQREALARRAGGAEQPEVRKR